MKKLILFVFYILSFLSSYAAMQQAAQGMIDEQLTGIPSIVEIIKNDIQDAKDGLMTLKELLENIKIYFKSSSYITSTNISIIKEGEGGIYFDFGYSDHGDLLKPFSGFKTRVDLNKVPDWLDVAFVNTLAGMGFDSIINVSPQNEFLIKFILLLNDTAKKNLTVRQAITEIVFLFYRLALVKDVNSFKSFFDGENDLIYKIISSVKVNGKKFDLILDEYWINFKEIVNYDFKIEKSNPYAWKPEYLIESDDWGKILKIASAVGLRTSVDYYAAREKFLKTEKGQILNLRIMNSKNQKEQIDAKKEFVKSMPEYQDILQKTQKITRGFLTRIKGVRKYWNEFVEKIRPVLDPFFESLGLPFDLIVGKFSDLENIDHVEDMYSDSSIVFDSDTSDIDFYGTDSFDITDF
ncbi:MAG: hypothetical protein ABIF12_03805 [bacterium]